jgi:hypothetical protein
MTRGGAARRSGHFMLLDTFVNVPMSSVPTVVMAVIAATAIRDAMRPYSMAVAPESSLTKRLNRVVIGYPCLVEHLNAMRSPVNLRLKLHRLVECPLPYRTRSITRVVVRLTGLGEAQAEGVVAVLALSVLVLWAALLAHWT